MSARMKKRLTNKGFQIFKNGEELKLPKEKERSLHLVISSFIDGEDSKKYSGADVFGKSINDPKMRVAKYLKGSRIKSNLTQAQVCKKLGVQQPNLSAMENGSRAIGKEMARKFARLYKANIKLLIS